MEEFTARAVFKHEEANFIPLPHLAQLDDVWMILNISQIAKVLTSSLRILISLIKVV